MTQDDALPSLTLLTVPEAADILGMSVRWTWQQVSNGSLPAAKFGRRRMIDPQDLRDFVAQNIARKDEQ